MLQRVPTELLSKYFTHRAWYGFVPVYVYIPDVDALIEGELRDEEVAMTERNYIPKYSLNIFKLAWTLLTIFYPSNPPLIITGDIEP